MAIQTMRANLAAFGFPFVTELGGRSIIVPQADQNYDRTVTGQADPTRDKGIPQAFYMHNCVPTTQGYQSVGYVNKIAPLVGAPDDFDTILPLSYSLPNLAKVLLSPAAGKNYIYDATVGTWVSTSPQPPGTIGTDDLITIAFVQGVSYIFYESIGCFTYNQTTKLLDPVSLLGLSTPDILGITAANGYMIAWDETTIAWSSIVTPTDFVPSLTTGAGSGVPQFCRGDIKFCVPISGGFMIYCEQNVVSATYSGNIRFPFIFAEVSASGGVQSPEQVSWLSNTATHWAWTTAGLQELSKTAASSPYPDATDFLAQLIFEDFSEVTLQLSQEYLTNPLAVKCTMVDNRYLIISYGVSPPNYTHALMLDLNLKRWGKLKINHRKCFEWPAPNLYGEVTYGMLLNLGTTYGDLINVSYGDLFTSVNTPKIPKKNIAFLQMDGNVKIVNFDMDAADANGVLMLGKFQYTRSRFIVHQESEIETLRQGNNFQFYLIPTLDGKTFLQPVTPYLLHNGPMIKEYVQTLHGLNITCLFIGAFNLTSYILSFTLGSNVFEVNPDASATYVDYS